MNTFSSPQDLGLAVLEALNTKDKALLYSYRILKKEYIDYLWLEFPARVNWPADFTYATSTKIVSKV